jgi:hypothetical protein
VSLFAGLLRRLRSRAGDVDLAMRLLRRIREIVGDARTVAEWRQRLAAGAERGDLDDVVGMLVASDAQVKDFIENG